MGKQEVKLAKCLGDIVAETGRIPKGASVRSAMQLLPVTAHGWIAAIYRRNGLIISRDLAIRYVAGCAVSVLISWSDMRGRRREGLCWTSSEDVCV